MGKKKFRITIKKEHKLCKEYVIGRISGLMYCICTGVGNTSYAGADVGEELVLFTETTKRKYMKLKKVIEKQYPGLCEFDI